MNRKAKAWAKTDGYCWYCGVMMNPFQGFCVDHVTPQIRNGSSHIENLVPCCRSCNSRKGTKTVEEYRVYMQSKAIPQLTPDQRSYFAHIGIALPDVWPEPPAYTFWFERHGETQEP